MISISKGQLTATAYPQYGGNLASLNWKGLELLRAPEPPDILVEKPEHYGLPVLFPPNRIADGHFTWNGRRCELPLNEGRPRNNHIHGLVLRQAWTIADQGDDVVVMEYRYGQHHDAFDGFPYPFCLRLSYRLDDDCLTQELVVQNCGDTPLPYGLGFHSAFNAPKRLRITTEPWRWEMLLPRHLPSERRLPWGDFDPNAWLDPSLGRISVHTPVGVGQLAGRPFRGAVLDYGERAFAYEIDDKFHQWFLWTPEPNSGFICPEPMSCMVNAPNLALPPETTGFTDLAPGSEVSYRSTIREIAER